MSNLSDYTTFKGVKQTLWEPQEWDNCAQLPLSVVPGITERQSSLNPDLEFPMRN